MRYLNPITDREEWLAARGRGIGGSDAGALLGWNPWKTATGIWRVKTGLESDEIEGNPAMYWGSMLEDRVAVGYAQQEGVRVLARDTWGRPIIISPDPNLPPFLIPDDHPLIPLLNPIVSPRYPWMRGNVDGWALDNEDQVIRGLEFKCTAERNRRYWKFLAPLSYVAQVWHNAAITYSLLRRSVPWDLVALIGGNRFGVVRVPFDRSLLHILLQRETEFWTTNVEQKIQPRDTDFSPVFWPLAMQEEGTMSVKIPAPKDRPRILAPKGIHRAVIADVVDRGEVDSTWQGVTSKKHKISVHFLLNADIPEIYRNPYTGEETSTGELAGRPFGVQQWYTASLHKRAAFRGLVEKLWERELTKEDIATLSDDAEEILGTQVQLVIVHAEKDGNHYANIDTVLPAGEGDPPVAIPDDYVRLKDRDGYDGPAADSKDDEPPF